MELAKLVTLTFDKNVGPRDRVGRLATGVAVIAGAWMLGLPPWAALPLTLLGAMWTATGVLSRCSIYYALGYSTCPARRPPAALP